MITCVFCSCVPCCVSSEEEEDLSKENNNQQDTDLSLPDPVSPQEVEAPAPAEAETPAPAAPVLPTIKSQIEENYFKHPRMIDDPENQDTVFVQLPATAKV